MVIPVWIQSKTKTRLVTISNNKTKEVIKNMKIKEYIIGLCSTMVVMFSSCNTDNEGAIYDGGVSQGVTFELSSQSVSFPSTGYEGFDIEVLRAKAETDLAVNVTGSLVQGSEMLPLPAEISVPSFVTFKAGEYKTNLHVSVGNITPGQNYKIVISMELTDITANVDNINSKTITIFRDYTYSSIGQGIFQSEAMADEGQDYAEWNVEVHKADQTSWYRAVSPYEEGKDVLLKINDANEVTVDAQPAWTDPQYGVVYITGSGTLENGVITVKAEFTLPDAGLSFSGTYKEVLILPVIK